MSHFLRDVNPSVHAMSGFVSPIHIGSGRRRNALEKTCPTKTGRRPLHRRIRACVHASIADARSPPPAETNAFNAGPVAESDVLLVLSGEEARELLSLQGGPTPGTTSVPVDLGRSTAEAVTIADGVQLHGAKLSWAKLRKMGSRGGAWALYGDDDAERVCGLGAHAAVSLYPVTGAPATLLVGGFGMHRFARGANPASDTAAKIAAARPAGDVLDICTGLGYTAIAAAGLDAVRSVVTIERDEAVVEVQRLNPWSRELFSHPKIERVVSDASELIAKMQPARFDTIIHDPPALALGGELYSAEFYCQLRRVCRDGATLFHYIGNPTSRESGRLYKGVAKRLQEAGFRGVVMAGDAFGVVAVAGDAGSGPDEGFAFSSSRETTEAKKSDASSGRRREKHLHDDRRKRRGRR